MKTSVQNLLVAGSILLFAPNELSAQIELVKNFAVTTFGNEPCNLYVIDDVMFLRSWTANEGLELWKSDGTEAGTVLVKDINPGSAGSVDFTEEFVSIGNVVYFSADDGVHGRELWRSDGTEGGTYMVKDIFPGATNSSIAYMMAAGERIYFRANDNNPSRLRLFASDGTAEGTIALNDGNGQSLYYDNGWPPAVYNGNIYYHSSYNYNSGCTIWKTGLNNFIAEPHVNIDLNYSFGVGIGKISAGTNGLFFHGRTSVEGSEIWFVSEVGDATLLADATPGFDNFQAQIFNLDVKDNIAYWCIGATAGYGLWRSDGTVSGTQRVKTMSIPNLQSGVEQTLRQIGDLVLFAGLGDEGYELWKSDGSESGTTLLKDINPGPNGSIAGNGTMFRVIDNILYFAAETPQLGVELWRSDGTTEGSVLVQDYALGSSSFGPRHIVKMGSYLYLTGQTNSTSRGIYRMEIPQITTVKQKETAQNIHIFPNPANDKLTLSLPESYSPMDVSVKITDICGRSLNLPISESQKSHLVLNLEHIANGVYYILLETNQGTFRTERVLISH